MTKKKVSEQPEAPQEQQPAPRLEPLMTVDCGDAGKWGLMVAQGAIAPLMFQGPEVGWQPSQIIPMKVAQHIDLFVQQHAMMLAPWGYPMRQPAAADDKPAPKPAAKRKAPKRKTTRK